MPKSTTTRAPCVVTSCRELSAYNLPLHHDRRVVALCAAHYVHVLDAFVHHAIMRPVRQGTCAIAGCKAKAGLKLHLADGRALILCDGHTLLFRRKLSFPDARR
jgi:hypothetical protein